MNNDILTQQMLDNVGKRGWFMENNKAISMIIYGIDCYSYNDFNHRNYIFINQKNGGGWDEIRKSESIVFLSRDKLLETI